MTNGGTGTRTFTLPAGLTGDVHVVGERRTIPVSNRTFTDTFAHEYTHDIYKVTVS